ncbi:alpha/beta hydrolase [Pannus brasiliensis CCIBt3594]|uniref:Alpha/beta hydrolase n=1 Tax=Pannus brasiliensis CCIBt3594 TaxID=1427578 RepID=A0AAW9QK63_9CHRO
MFLPIGFGQHSLSTSLGNIVYYTAEGEPWTNAATSRTGAETLIFLHGFGGGSSAYEWSKVYPAFAADYRVLAPDLIGWGRSDHPARNYTIDDYITTIVEFVEKSVDRPTTVIASALTAAFTIRAAIARPALFKSLILTTAAGLSEFGKNYADSFFAGIVRIPALDRFLYGTGVATAGGIRNFLEQRQFARPERVSPEMVEAYLQSARQPNAEYAALAFVRGDLCFDLSRYISELTVPTALIWGRRSEFTGPDVGRRLAAMNPKAVRVFEYLEDVGFTPQLELPAVTIGLIRKCLPLLEKADGSPSRFEARTVPDR